MESVALLLRLLHALRSLQILSLVEAVAETLTSLLHFLLDLLVVLGNLILDEHIGTIALLRVAVVDEGIVEGIHVSAGLPYRRVHEDGRVDTHDVLVQHRHGLPPVLLNVILQLNTVLTVVIHGA